MERAVLASKGNQFEDFSEGQVYEHHWGRTLTDGDSTWFSTQTLSFNPLYFNEPYAQSLGHPKMVVNPMLIFNTAFGLSVEDLSEGGGLFLGVVLVGRLYQACVVPRKRALRLRVHAEGQSYFFES